ncbi:MAG: hypothetical protein BGN86_00490 [Caulobacterales bacterium 68-7]|nr:MAG: hypothetical protein BGN86_00490 [Caulobacterales bacterium 68-7]
MRATLCKQPDRDLPDLFQRDVDWETLVEVAIKNRIAVLFARALREHAIDPPAVWQARLDRYRAETFRNNARNIATADAVSSALRAAGVDVVVFKGPAQQQRLYNDPFTKPVGDVDVLVPISQYEQALGALDKTHKLDPDCASPWWRIFLGEQHLRTRDGRLTTVDLHYRLQQPGCPSPKNIEGFLQRREVATVGAVQLSILSPPDACLLTCLNVVKALVHREACGRYLVDLIAGLHALEDHQVAQMVGTARSEGLIPTMALSLRVLEAVFGFSDPRVQDVAKAAPANSMDLVGMTLLPDDPRTVWTKRRDILWMLCGQRPIVFIREAAWAFAGEMCRQFSHLTRGRLPEGTAEVRRA